MFRFIAALAGMLVVTQALDVQSENQIMLQAESPEEYGNYLTRAQRK